MPRYQLDDIDERMLDILRRDGRTPFPEIAHLVGLSPDAARARYTRLTDDGVLRVIGLVHPRSLGFERLASAWVSYRGRTEELAKHVRSVPGITFMTELLGRYNLLVEVAARDDAEVADVVQSTFLTRPDVTAVEICSFLEIVKWQTQARRGVAAAAPATDLTPLDSALLRLLVDNPRASYRELSGVLQEPYWTVRKRTQALFADGIIRSTAMVDRLSTQSERMASVEIHLAGPAGADALRAIARLDQVALLSVTSGHLSALGEASCPDDAALADLGAQIRAIPGVARADIRPYVRTLVVAMPWSIDPAPRWRPAPARADGPPG
jgi:DNA-binding Lrp family transcriptional regulator